MIVVKGFITRFNRKEQWEEELEEVDEIMDSDAIPHYIEGEDGRYYEYYGRSIPLNKKVFRRSHGQD